MNNTVYAAAGDLEITPLGGAAAITNIGSLISAVIGAFFLIAFVIAFVMIVLGGVEWVTSGGDKEHVQKARDRITHALIGLAIVAGAWAIMTLVQAFFGISILGGFDLPSAVNTKP